MSFKHFIALGAITALTACGGSGSKTDVTNTVEFGDGSSTCPNSEVLADVSTYKMNHTAPNSDYAAWHAANGNRDGVVTTESGLQYQVIKKGNASGPSPAPTDTVRVNYHGFHPNGEIFDSSYARGQDIEFPLNRVIKGWTEGVGLMKPCDAWTFYIPGRLAYGDNGSPRSGIGPDATLAFHVQLIEVK